MSLVYIAIFSTTLLNTHCKPFLYINSFGFLADPGYIYTADSIFGSPESFPLVQGMF